MCIQPEILQIIIRLIIHKKNQAQFTPVSYCLQTLTVLLALSQGKTARVTMSCACFWRKLQGIFSGRGTRAIAFTTWTSALALTGSSCQPDTCCCQVLASPPQNLSNSHVWLMLSSRWKLVSILSEILNQSIVPMLRYRFFYFFFTSFHMRIINSYKFYFAFAGLLSIVLILTKTQE